MKLFGKKKENGEKSKKHFSKEELLQINKKYLRNGSYSTMMIVIFVAIVVVVNLIVDKLPTKYTQIDTSDSLVYSIGDQTKELLKGLEKDVSLYLVAETGSEDEKISNMLQKYAEESKHVTVEQKDPVVSPKFVSEYTDDDVASNSVIVVCGDRSKVVAYSSMYESSIDYNTYSYQTTGFDGEGQITSAISYVTSDSLPILYNLEGHGEDDLDSTIEEGIEKANIEVKTLNLLTEESVPDDADCLLINSPSSDISEDEKDAILEYLENGGKAMIFSDYTEEELPNFAAVLENYGVKTAEGIVFEGDNQHYGMQMPYYLLPTVNSTDASSETASSGYYILMPYAQGIQELDDVRDTVTIEHILDTSDSAYSKINLQSETIEKEDDDIGGPFALGVRITEDVGDEQTQIIYYSTAYLMDSQINQMVSGGNEKLVLESISSLVSSDETTTISIPSKSLEVSYLTISDYDASFWKICVIGLIPGIFLVGGFVIWLKRRKA